MPEILTLTTPIIPVTRTTYKVIRLILDWEAKVIQAYMRGSDNVEILCEWLDAAAIMTVLNTANLSTTSLHKRILQRAIADGKLGGGIVSGVAE